MALGKLKDKKDAKTLTAAFGSQSYLVQGAALVGLSEINATTALARAKTLEGDSPPGPGRDDRVRPKGRPAAVELPPHDLRRGPGPQQATASSRP
ncbi:MAG: hypothetical protein WKG07_01070 [Hymenobacter sp.]